MRHAVEVRQTLVFQQWRERHRDGRFKAAVATRIVRIQAGDFGDFKNLGDGVGELRFDLGPGYRVYFHRDGAVVLILLCGGDKKTQAADIRAAKAMVRDKDI